MKSIYSKLAACAGALSLALVLVPGALAECGLPANLVKPMSWNPLSSPAHLLLTSEDRDKPEPSIVGMWHVIFTAQTSNGQPIGGSGLVVDNSVVVWHPDGTEIMNSSRSAQDGNFCLGVWECTGPRSYLLNHIPWQGNIFDPTAPAGTIGAAQDGVQILEKIVLSPDGNSYTGKFTLNAYTTSGNVYQSFVGTLTAKRITPETPFSSLL
jgi:hypothetical protein